jgi:hypothetical protein
MCLFSYQVPESLVKLSVNNKVIGQEIFKMTDIPKSGLKLRKRVCSSHPDD